MENVRSLIDILELSVEEDPADDRNMHYLGREYMYKGRWDACIAVLLRHLAMPTARWRDERAASMRYIARAYAGKGDRAAARDWYLRAAAEAGVSVLAVECTVAADRLTMAKPVPVLL